MDPSKARDNDAPSAWRLALMIVAVLPNAATSLLTSIPARGIAYPSAHSHHNSGMICGSRICRRYPRKNNVASSSASARLCKHRWTNHDRIRPLFASEDDRPEEMDEETKPNEVQMDENGNASGRTDSTTSKKDDGKPKPNILEMINPFNAGKNLRSRVESAIDLASAITNDPASRLPPDRRAIYYDYYLDDQLGLGSLELKADPKFDASTAPSWLSSEDDDDYRPEVLVVGAAGELGRVLVKRLILENKVRIRVLVRDLYSSTLNKLGTGVTYCQGDLNDMESLEYAVTDVDKIVFCAGVKSEMGAKVEDWDNMESVLEQRSKEAAMVDGTGLRNLIGAYLNVRYADYGNSQAAKRTLFKFSKRPADFGLFGLDDGSVDGSANDALESSDGDGTNGHDVDGASRSSYAVVAAALSQCEWKRNKFSHGCFTGKVGRYGEAAIASARLRSRNDPEKGMDLRSGGFAGIVCRVCSDGGVYEAFVRTEAYERLGVEYVCEFKTSSKSPTAGENTSRTKWSTVRLAFSDFRPRMRQFQAMEGEDAQRMKQALGKSDIPPFTGRDIRQLGFRYRGKNNPFSERFYLALDYIKVYRGQPEPEFIYLSDAGIPPVVNDWMIKHDLHRLVTTSSESSNSYSIIDEEQAKERNQSVMDRSSEETYFKYMGEEMIRQSGLSYTIIRVAGYNTDLGTDSSAVRLQKMNKNITSVSRVDLAQVIASALLEPNACNLVLYMTKAQERGVLDGNLWQKFARLQAEK